MPARPPGRKAAWPDVLGWVGIGFGATGLCCFGCGGFVNLMYWIGPDSLVMLAPKNLWFVNVQLATMTALSGLLLAAGVRLRARRCSARRFALLWAWLKIGTSFALTIGSLVTGLDAAAVSGLVGLSQTGMIVIALVSGVFGLVWSCTLPLILIIWFARPTIRQQVAGWPAEGLKSPSVKTVKPAPPPPVRKRKELPPGGFEQWS